MKSDYQTPVKQILRGNILLIICCGFYLALWLLVFRPVDPLTKMTMGWKMASLSLLMAASITGLAAVVYIIRGVIKAGAKNTLFTNHNILWGGIAAFFISYAVTLILFSRPVTTELLLIIGWGALSLAEMNALFSRGVSLAFTVVIATCVTISLVCYVLYYRLDAHWKFYDGMVPLLLIAFVMLGFSIYIALAARTGR